MWSRRSPSSRPRVAYGQEVALTEVSNRVELDERAGDLSRLDLRPIVAVPVLGERDLIAGGIGVRLAGPRPARRTGWTARTWMPPGTGIARRSAGRWPRIPGSRGRRACHTRPRTVRTPTRRAWPWQQPTASHGRSGLRLWRICTRVCLDCASICATTATLIARGSPWAAAMATLCVSACEQCAAECGKHDDPDCQECAATCRRCAEQCRSLAASTS